MYSTCLKNIVEIFEFDNVLHEIDLSERMITRKEINRPALQLTGFYHRFDSDRMQVIGRVEHSYLQTLTPEARDEAICHLFEQHIPCLIICKGLEVFPEMISYGRRYEIPLFSTKKSTTDTTAELIMYLRAELADRVTMHGVLVDVYGEGVLITGASGIGKSETALELIKRGHRLIADDAVEIRKVADRMLIGTCPELIRNLIEVRGIGIIDVKELFGIGAVKLEKTVDLIIRLEVWDGGPTATFDRLGLSEEYIDILGNKVLCNKIPIRPGRNVAVICECAAITNRQRKMGYNTAEILEKKVLDSNN